MSREILIPGAVYIQDLKARVANTQQTIDHLRQRLDFIEHEELPGVISRYAQLSQMLRQHNSDDRGALVQEREGLAGLVDKLEKERRRSGVRLVGYLSVLNTLRLEFEITEANVEIHSWLW